MAPRKIALLTDSCADLSQQRAEENRIHIVPLRIRCADGEYRDGVDITPTSTGGSAPVSCPRPLCLSGRTSTPSLTAWRRRATTESSP